MDDIVIVSAARTPVGSFSGALGTLSAHELGTVALRAAFERAGVEAADVDEVILGQVLAAGEGQNPARQAARAAGLPDAKTAFGINQVCGSGLRAVALAAQQIRTGESAIVAAGGMESMSTVAALGLSARGTEDGRRRVHRHDAEGRAVGRVPRLPHGQHGRERRQQVPDHPRAAGPVRTRLAAEGECRAEGRPLQGRDRAGDGEDAARATWWWPTTSTSATTPASRRWRGCGRRSARTAR